MQGRIIQLKILAKHIRYAIEFLMFSREIRNLKKIIEVEIIGLIR